MVKMILHVHVFVITNMLFEKSLINLSSYSTHVHYELLKTPCTTYYVIKGVDTGVGGGGGGGA